MKKRREKNKKSNKEIYDVIARYSIALLLSLNSLFIFYYVFRPLTFFPAVFILKIMYSAQAFGIEKIIIHGKEIVLINSCVAGAAYYMFAVLNLSTFGIEWAKRIKIFIINSIALLLVNILRIIMLAFVLVNISGIFDSMHFIFWNFLSTIFVVGIWIFTIKKYKIRHIPLISDIQYLRKLIKKN